MKRYNKPEIAIIALSAFIFFAKYSWDAEPGYTKTQVSSMDRLVEKVNKQKRMSHENAEKIIALYGN